MFETRRLAPEDVDRWSHLLTPQVAGLVDPTHFRAWRDQVWSYARLGVLESWGAFAGEDPVPAAVLLTQEAGGHRTVMLGMGALAGEALRALVARLQGASLALSWQEATGPGWADRLADLGVRRFEHQTWANHLGPVMARLAAVPPDPAIVPWDDAWLEDALGLIVAANAGGLAGLLLALPHPPTAAAIAREVRAMIAEPGSLMREASFGYLVDGALAGVVVLLRLENGPSLYELAVSEATRGRGAGKHLVHAAQRALAAAGHAEMAFWTTDANAPVHRISKPGESTCVAQVPSAYWFAPALAAEAGAARV